MKKLVFIILVCASVIGCNGATDVSIVDYGPGHKDGIMEIAFQDPELFFPGYSAEGEAAYKKQMLSDCDEPLKYKKVVLDSDGKVRAFAIYFKSHESGRNIISSFFVVIVSKLISVVSRLMPAEFASAMRRLVESMQTTEGEGDYVLLESIAVSQDSRGMGYARKLIQVVFEESRQKWFDIVSIVKLHVNESNTGAVKLYESEGFNRSEAQSMAWMKITQYEKALS